MKGRGNRTAITTGAAMKLDINFLIKTKSIQEGKTITSIQSWTSGAKIQICSVYNDKDQYIHLKYSITDHTTNESEIQDYKIYIGKVPSNLGKGYNLYFYCPESAIRCKVLYMCYGSNYFKCRQAYNKRIYYSSQTHSKVYRPTGQHFHLNRVLDTLYEKRKTNTYKGKKTIRAIRMSRLIDKRIEADRQIEEDKYRWLCKYLGIKYYKY